MSGLLRRIPPVAAVALCSFAALTDPLPPDATYRPLPTLPFAAVRANDEAQKPQVMQRQEALLNQRYDLSDRPIPGVMMSGGRKPIQGGVRVKLPSGVTWDSLAAMSPDEIRQRGLLPAGFMPLPHVKQATGGQVFPSNQTDDRKSPDQSLGVTCLDCHANFHTNAAFHLTPDVRPQAARFRLDTTSLRGMFNQQIHGSKRSLRSVEDFTEFEQRTAYFNGDPIHAMKKGLMILDRVQVSHMAQMQNMFDFPPAPKLNAMGKLDPAKASESERRGEA